MSSVGKQPVNSNVIRTHEYKHTAILKTLIQQLLIIELYYIRSSLVSSTLTRSNIRFQLRKLSCIKFRCILQLWTPPTLPPYTKCCKLLFRNKMLHYSVGIDSKLYEMCSLARSHVRLSLIGGLRITERK